MCVRGEFSTIVLVFSVNVPMKSLELFTLLLVTIRIQCLFDLLTQLWWVLVILVTVAVTGVRILTAPWPVDIVLLLKLISMLVVFACTKRNVVAQPVVLLITMGILRLQTNPPRPRGLRLPEIRLVDIMAL